MGTTSILVRPHHLSKSSNLIGFTIIPYRSLILEVTYLIMVICMFRVNSPHSAFDLFFSYMADSMLAKLGRPSEVGSGGRAYNQKRPTIEFRSRPKDPAADFRPPTGPIRERKGRRRPFAGAARHRQRRCHSDAAALRPLRSGRHTSGARRGGCGEAGEKDLSAPFLRRRQRRRPYDAAAYRPHRSGGFSFWPPTKTMRKSRRRELGGTVLPPGFRPYAGAFRDLPTAPSTPAPMFSAPPDAPSDANPPPTLQFLTPTTPPKPSTPIPPTPPPLRRSVSPSCSTRTFFPLPDDGPEKHAKREWRQSLRNTDVSRRVVHFSDCRTLLSMSDTSIDVAASRPLAFTPPTLPTPTLLLRRDFPTSSTRTPLLLPDDEPEQRAKGK